MTNVYRFRHLLCWCVVLLGAVLLGSGSAQAQSGPYGNEWIVTGQPYYKIQVAQDGIYRLDYAYLTQAGLSGVNPQRLQLWRRGQQVAIYVGGTSPTVMDASTYVEFYGQRNDGALDKGMYKNAADQAQRHYSLYTDTAAYFLTYSNSALGRRMAEPVVNPVGGQQPYWMQPQLAVQTERYNDVALEDYVYQPWAEAGEGFLSRHFGKGFDNFGGVVSAGEFYVDSVRSRATTGPLPLLEVMVVGASAVPHTVNLYVMPQGSTQWRVFRTFVLQGFEQRKIVERLQRTDVRADGQVKVLLEVVTAATPGTANNFVSLAYLKVTFPQTPRWLANRRSFSFSNDSTLGSAPAYYTLDSIPATVRGFDITDPYNLQRITGVAGAGRKRTYVFPNALPGARTRNLLLADVALPLVPLPAQRVQFRTITPSAHNFLIVSHQALMRPAGDTLNPVREYAKYRASAGGGRYDTLVVTTDQLYNQFHYGEKSALAIRQFGLYMLTNTREKYLLLLGKGLITGEVGNGNLYHRKNPLGYSPTVRDLVPTSTRGASDAFFTADWPRNDYAARMATGRISAQTPREVLDYLNKLKEHEDIISRPYTPDLAWRKNALHLGGGEEPYQFELFAEYLNEYKVQIEKPFFAGTVVKTYSRTTLGLPQEINIASELNTGLAIINYFGHGSPQELSLGLGNVRTNPAKGYNNRGKYPIMFANGCAAGNSFSIVTSLYPEDWLLAPKKGLIGFMSESSFGFESTMHVIQKLTNQLLLNDAAWYGKPVADVQNEVARRLQNGALNNPVGQSALMNTVWHADPAVRLFSPAKPDFAFGATPVTVAPIGTEPVRTSSRQFKLEVQVRNPGKVTYDRLDISVKRTYDPTTLPLRADTLYTFTNLRQALRDTTYTLVLQNSGNSFGSNQFTVTLDYQNRVDELNESNNQTTTSFAFLQDGITLLNPPEFAIVSTAKPRLVGQTNDPRGPVRGFVVELDTTLSFSSPLVQRTRVQAPLLADWRPTLPVVAGRDSVVWYWRMRFETQLTPTENTQWVTSSFRQIVGSVGGWSQSHHGQFGRDELQRVQVAGPGGQWRFSDITKRLTLQTRGGGTGGITFLDSYGLQVNNEPLSVLECGVTFPNILVSIFDGRSLKSLRTVAGAYDSCGTAPNRFYQFASSATDNINSSARQAQLLALLTNVPRGAYVALLSVNKVNFSSFSAPLKAALAALGSQKINQLQDGDPFVFIGQKGPGGQPAREATADLGSAVPRAEQVISLSGAMTTQGGSGVVTSTRIGPAQQWTTLHHTVRPGLSGRYTLRLLGIAADGRRTVLEANVTRREYALSNVSAKDYPYLQLQLVLQDTVNRTAPQVEQLLVTYQGVPEGLVRRDSVVAKTPTIYDAAALAKQAEGGSITIPVIFQNVSGLPFGTPLKAVFTLRNATKETTKEIDVPALGANGAVSFNASMPLDLYGDISGSVTLNIDKNRSRLPELYYFNNELTLPTFTVEDRSVPPVLDVAFDGQHILNGDIVSPRPIISVLLTDEDKQRPITDRSAFDLVLTPRNGTPQKVNLNASNVTFLTDPAKGTARIEYKPGEDTPLPDGQYTLEVQGRDATGRAAGPENYRVSFEVINASSITNFFPYPNPITSSAQFVFTLTGAELPRNLKIQVLTLTGKVVKQIMMQELGPLRIGTNVTSYRWDGTDEYGDRLANGTYLYRVVLDDAKGQFERRTTLADQAFKNGWGKLVLLR
ncbi:C25 family cysteine peptidase [Hymenobacter sp. BT635]|uniref:C25 family cysteine peptidase n=1 Tax=Hymenobacter nitidus TaxID=2880929 RepID=A0ABS8AAF3_9BACT|nr:C25 family cysteine peptidase [Hymenobacter nitidus]MCB2377363.1 C25 family cysteine peptidase [Hymenobacter nitidus]